MTDTKIDPSTTLTTLNEATEWLAERFDAGVHCPCCGQLVKRYKRKLNSSMAYVLILLFHREQYGLAGDADSFKTIGPYVHVPSYLVWCTRRTPAMAAATRGDWAKLVHWDLIEAMPGQEREDGSKRAGFYKVTAKGDLFVNNALLVPAHIYLYNQEVQAQPDDTQIPMVSIRDALGVKFNYAELMEGL